jgi:hypothetical protein
MAGAAGSWYKTGKATKGRVFISKETIRDSLGGASVTDAELADARAKLAEDPERYSSMIATLSEASPQSEADWRKRVSAPAGYQIPQRSQADREALAQGVIDKATDEWNRYHPNDKIDGATARRRIQGVLERISAETNLATMINPGILERVLDSGFKNQHATNSSGATLSPARRAEAENRMFGIPEDSSPDAFPIYGFLDLKSGEVTGVDGIDGLMIYGTAKVVFKDAIRARTTMSVDDSLYEARQGRLMPTPLNVPGITAADNNASILLSLADRPTSEIMNQFSYIETQIHGPTTVADIARVEFGSMEPPSAALAARLDSLGIGWKIVEW